MYSIYMYMYTYMDMDMDTCTETNEGARAYKDIHTNTYIHINMSVEYMYG
jgi:hypothetical protein